MIEYPSSLATPVTPTFERRRSTRDKLENGQLLARMLALEDPKHGLGSRKQVLQAIQAFASLKQQVAQLQKECQISQKALVATQCSRHCMIKRLQHLEQQQQQQEEQQVVESPVSEVFIEDDKLEIADSIAMPEALEEDLETLVWPKQAQSLGVGLLGDVEAQLVEWQQSFARLNDEHERQVQECQAQLERLHVRLQAASKDHANSPKVLQARAHLERLVDLVEAFPSKARVEQLQAELAHSRKAEQATQVELAAAMQELEEAKTREQALLDRVQHLEAQQVDTIRQRKSRNIPVRFLVAAKKKIHRLFRLHRSVPQEAAPSQPTVEEQVTSTSPPARVEQTTPDTSFFSELEALGSEEQSVLVFDEASCASDESSHAVTSVQPALPSSILGMPVEETLATDERSFTTWTTTAHSVARPPKAVTNTSKVASSMEDVPKGFLSKVAKTVLRW